MAKKSPATVSVLISTYNWKEALELSVKSIWSQTQLPDEIVIADDGSGPDTKALIEELQRQSPVPIFHCWQPDEGFRAARIRNKAIVQCSGEYIIQIDGDIICDPRFIKDHLTYAAAGNFVCGRRFMLSAGDSLKTIAHKQLSISEESKKQNKVPNRFRVPVLMNLLKLEGINHWVNKGLLGCNMGYWRKDALHINGYNILMEGWGREDDEFGLRLQHSNIKKISLRFGAIVYHLYHKERAQQEGFQRNNVIMQQTIDQKLQKAPSGIQELNH